MREPLISIIMPAFNARKYIAESIRSVLAQTYGHWELLVVDDGSSDGTGEVVRGFAPDERIKYLRRPNGGQGKARNTGLKKSVGELVAFLDSDDLWEAGKLELQVKTIDETKADVVFSDGIIFVDGEANQETAFSSLSDVVGCGEMGGEQMFRRLFVSNGIPVLSVLVRRAALDRVNLFDESRRYQNCEDYDLWLKLARKGASFYGMKERLVRYRRHSQAMTFSSLKLLDAEIAVLSKHAREFLSERRRGGAGARSSRLEDTAFIDKRLSELREIAVSVYMHRYQTNVLQGELLSGLPLLWKIARIEPSRISHPRWLLGTVLRGTAAMLRRKTKGSNEKGAES